MDRQVCWLLAIFTGLFSVGTTAGPVYPPSEVITGISIDIGTLRNAAPGNGARARDSDNWAITWADDGHQYTTWGDGVGFGTNDSRRASLGVGRIEGGPDSYRAFDVFKTGLDAGGWAGKSVGLISIDGTLYLFRNGTGSGSGAFEQTELYKSTNRGATWTYTGVRWRDDDFADGQGFFAPTFLQFGRDHAGARDNFVYIYAPEHTGSVDGDAWNVQKPGKISLLRVSRESLSNQSAYEYFAGLNSLGQPRWSSDHNQRTPVFVDAVNGVMRTSVSFNAGLNKYLLVTQQINRFEDRDYHIGIYEAPEPWGPWRTVHFDNAGRTGPGLNTGSKTVYWNFSNKWLSPDGRDFVLVYTGDGADEWGTVKGRFEVADGGNPPAPVPPPTQSRERYLGFDGQGDHVTIADHDDLDLNGPFTLSAWLRPVGWGGNSQGRILDHGGGSEGGTGWSLHVENRLAYGSPEALRVQINDRSDFQGLSGEHSIRLARWQHVAVTFDGDVLRFYVDGVAAGERAGAPVPRPRDAAIRIGARLDGRRGFDGDIDDVRIWNRALSPQEIRDSIDAEVSGLEPGLIAYWRFDEGSGQTAFDATPAKHDGRLGASSGSDSDDPSWQSPSGNQPPSVNAGADAVVTLPQNTLMLDAAVSDDGLPRGTLSTVWRVLSGPEGATFSDPAAVDTTVTFSQAGEYVLQLSASDSELTATDRLTVTVESGASSTLTRIDVSPASVTLALGQQQQFIARGIDQYGAPISIDPQWSATGGGTDANGLYTAGAATGEFTVAAADGHVRGEAEVIISATGGRATRLMFADDDYVRVGDHDDLDLNGPFTLSAWIRPTGWGENDQGRIIDHGGGSDGDAGWSLHVENNTTRGSPQALRMQINNDSSFVALSASRVVRLAEWQHVAVSFDGDALRFYVNGFEAGEHSGVPLPRPRQAAVLMGARLDGRRGYAGEIDDVQIWSRALDREQIQILMHSQPSGSEPGLIAHWRFDEGSGQVVFDSGPAGHDGQLGVAAGSDDSDPSWPP